MERGERMTLGRRGNALMGLVAALVVAGAAFGWTYHRSIVAEPGEHLSRAHIRNVIAQESPVLFRDGQTRIGVFFAREHREYVTYEEIPRAWVSAITAAEDQRYWKHIGVDVAGIARAMLRNIQAGRMVAGGSTLTQQTAKNLYYRPDRSLGSKWTELLNALRLESHFSKEEILEFYANQFHVSSNGRGLGIAARYFFDKEVAELSTLECAFLAGLVKAPSRYNPFIGKTESDRVRARERAHERTRYVLGRMLAEGVLTPAVHAELVATDIAFEKGSFQYESNVILDEVEARLSQAPFPALFESLGVDNPSTAGISIVTTLDESAQRGAQHALGHHLTEVGPLLEGVPSFSSGSSMKVSYDPGRSVAPGTFHAAKPSEDEPTVLALPHGTCTLDAAAIQRAADVVARAEAKNSWSKGGRAHRDRVVARLASGDPVFVSVRSADGEERLCDLEHRPELQGAVMLLEEGRIRAMVGGSENRDFNRSINAKRQLGSIWKPVLYNAALQLGWAPTDAVDNRSNVFHFEGTWYYPRADHENTPWPTLAWLGPRSENLGSIWLLMHLMDRLTHPQFEAVARSLGLTRTEDEEYAAYVRRIRDDNGVISTQGRLNEIAFTASKLDVLESMPVDEQETREVRSLFYGRGLDAERTRVGEGDRAEEKLAALDRSYRTLAQRGNRCIEQGTALVNAVRAAAEEDPLDGLEPEDAPAWLSADLPDVPDFTEYPDLSLSMEDGTLVCRAPEVEGEAIDAERWWSWVRGEIEVPDLKRVRVDGAIRLGTLARLHSAMKRRLLVWTGADPYDWSVLQFHPDLRTLVALRYMGKVASNHGVRQPLPPVMSIPLGAVDVSLLEAANLYQGMMEGQRRNFEGHTEGSERLPLDVDALLIKEILDRDGRVLFRSVDHNPPAEAPVAGRQVGDVLRNVVRWGTGRRALNEVLVNGAVVPVSGKTGTTNGYRNAAFAGFVPRLVDGAWSWAQGYTLVSYIGYDDNRSMRKGSVRLQGSNGALPIWMATAQAMAAGGLLGMPDASTPPEWTEDGAFRRVPIDPQTGAPAAESMDGAEGPSVLAHGIWETQRSFSPEGLSEAEASALVRLPTDAVEVDVEQPVDRLWAPVDSGSADP
jgi:membrane peptidoglycan carboxypeptidase